MIVGYDFIGSANAVSDTRISFSGIGNVTLKEGMYDELLIKNGSYPHASTAKEEWTYPTVILAKFQNDLVAGNMDFLGTTISHVEVRRRKITDLNEWRVIGRMPYAPGQRTYFYDRFNESGENYEYALIPIANDGIEGVPVKQTIYSEFDSIFVLDKNEDFKFQYDINLSANEKVSRSVVVEPLGGKYPIVIANGDISYRKGTVSAKLITDKNRLRLRTGERVDQRTEMLFRDQVLDFLTKNNTKILKFPDGGYYLVRIIDAVPYTLAKEWGHVFADVTFNWVQIADNTDAEMIAHGLLEEVYNG